jgi:hypothetical protein
VEALGSEDIPREAGVRSLGGQPEGVHGLELQQPKKGGV